MRFGALLALLFAQLIATRAHAQTCEKGTSAACHDEGAEAEAAEDYGRAFALFARGCNDGQADACSAIPALLQEHPKARDGGPKIWRALVRECKQKNDAMCVQLARDVVDNVDRVRRFGMVRTAVRAACKRDVGAACTARGVMARAQRAGLRRARADFERGCELGDGVGCRLAGELVEAKDPTLAQLRYRTGCEHDDATSCGRQGRLLAGADPAAAAPLLARGCDAGDAVSCLSLARLHQQGGFEGADLAVAESAYRSACDEGGNVEACARLGSLLLGQGKQAEVEPLLSRGCEGGQAQACTDLGVALTARGETKAAARSFGRARRVNQRACQRGDGAACLSVAEDYALGRGVRADEAKSALWLRRACVAGAGGRERCLETGIASTRAGRGREAKTVLGPLCDAGEPRACMALVPVTKHSEREALYRRACELGDRDACSHVPGVEPEPEVAVAAVPTPGEAAPAAPSVAPETEKPAEPAIPVVRAPDTTAKPAEAPAEKPAEAAIPVVRAPDTTAKPAEQPREAAIPVVRAPDTNEQQAERARHALARAEAAQKRAEEDALAARRRESEAQRRAEWAVAQEAAQRALAEKAAAREAAARTEAAQAKTREAAAQQKAKEAAAREQAARAKAKESQAAARREARQAATREARSRREAEQAAQREALARKRAEENAAGAARDRARAEKALASHAAARKEAERAVRAEKEARAEAQKNAAEAREARAAAEREATLRAAAEKRADEERALAQRQAEARRKAEEREAKMRARAEEAEARKAELERAAAAREAARREAEAAAAREARERKEAEERVAEAQRRIKEAEANEAEARRKAREAAAAREAARAAAAREAAERRRAEARDAAKRREAEKAAAREKERRERAAAREAAARRKAEAAAAREAKARKEAAAAAAREAEARKRAEAREAEKRRKAELAAKREAAARRRAEKQAEREAAARRKAEEAAAREAAAREAAAERERKQRERAEALAKQAAEARAKAKEREQKLLREIEEAKEREAEARRQRAELRKAQQEAEAARKKARQEQLRLQAEMKRAAAKRAAEERAREAQERRDELARRKAAEEREARKEREAKEIEVKQVALACEGGHAPSCMRAGVRMRDGVGTKADPQRALVLFERGCAAGSAKACKAGIPLVKPKTPADQKRLGGLLSGACTNGKGDADACERAVALLIGTGDDARPLVARLARRGCALRPDRACVIAGDIAAKGKGVPVNRAQACESFGRVCSEKGSGIGCDGLDGLCAQGVLEACERLDGAPHADGEAASPALEQAAEMRLRGDDSAAARLLEVTMANEKTARLQAELGLAYEGTGRFVDAERLLSEALESPKDPWIDKHHGGLERALGHAESHLGWIVLECSATGELGYVRGREVACGKASRIEVGEHMVELRAPDRRSVQLTVNVARGKRANVSAELEPFTCPNRGMLHMGGVAGDCCWIGQSWVSGACSGATDASVQLASAGGGSRDRELATVRLSLLGGVTNFVGDKNTLFRTGVNENDDSATLGPRAEIRVGIPLGSFLSLEGIAGGARRALTYWGNCELGADCVIDFPAVNTMDFGAMLQAHTFSRRSWGNFDFHVGVGVRPWTRILLQDQNMGTTRLTSTVFPAELGASFFLGSSLSLDLLGQGEFWLPWDYCDSSTGECTEAVHSELGWSALAGLTFHIH